MSLLRFLGLGGRADSQTHAIEGVRTIVDALDTLEPDRARHLGAFAYILSRIAHVDQHVSQQETETIERVVAQEGRLPPPGRLR